MRLMSLASTRDRPARYSRIRAPRQSLASTPPGQGRGAAVLYVASMRLQRLPGELAIARLPPGEPIPQWAHVTARFVSIVRTADELSIVCPAERIPLGVRCSSGWVALKVMGQVDLSAVGVLASLADILRDARVSIFAVSTYDTDYLLVPQSDEDRSIQELVSAGHDVVDWA